MQPAIGRRQTQMEAGRFFFLAPCWPLFTGYPPWLDILYSTPTHRNS